MWEERFSAEICNAGGLDGKRYMRPCLFGVVFGPDFGILFCSAFCSAVGIAIIVVFAALLTYGVFCSRARKPNKTRLFANSVPHGP